MRVHLAEASVSNFNGYSAPALVSTSTSGRDFALGQEGPLKSFIGVRGGFVLAVMLYLLLGSGFVSSVPPWEAPDETWHAEYASVLAAGRLPTLEETYEAHHPPGYYLGIALWMRVLNASPLPRAEANPRYPFATSVFLHPPDEALAGPLRLLRTLSAQWGVLALAFVWSIGARLGLLARGTRRDAAAVAAAAALCMAAWPQWLFISHSLSNDVAATTVGALLSLALVRTVPRPPRRSAHAARRRPDGTPRAALSSNHGTLFLLAFGGVAAIWSKLNAIGPAVAVSIAAPVLSLTVTRIRTRERRFAAPKAWILALAAASWIGMATGLLLLLLVAPSGTELYAQAVSARAGLAAVQPASWAGALALSAESAWGRMGWMNVAMPPAGLALGVAVHVVAALGWVRASSSIPMPARWSALALLSVVAVAWVAFARNLTVDPQTQGRLLFPALPAWCVLCGFGWHEVLRRRPYRRTIRRGREEPMESTGPRTVRSTSGGDIGEPAGTTPAMVSPQRSSGAVFGTIAGMVVLNVTLVVHTLPDAYRFARAAIPPVVFERILPPTWRVIASLDREGAQATQSFTATSNELQRVEIPVLVPEVDTRVHLRVVTEAGAVLGRSAFTVKASDEYVWLGVELGVQDSADGDSAIGESDGGHVRSVRRGEELRLEISHAGPAKGRMLLWGEGEDFYPRGSFQASTALEGERLDLVMLWTHSLAGNEPVPGDPDRAPRPSVPAAPISPAAP